MATVSATPSGREVDLTVRFATIHGHRRAYVKAGQGPVLLLLHGIGCDHTTWLPVIPELSRNFTVIAPDLLGHGLSDKPRADYSVAGYANGMRDLLTFLGHDKATVVGHSFGGGVAAQFAYQYPERTERLVLVSAGGLGREVTAAIRAITLPGFHEVMGLATLPGIRHLGKAGLRMLSRLNHPALRDLGEVAVIYEGLRDPRSRFATRRLVTGVIDRKGQVVTIRDRAYLTAAMPILVIWGKDDFVVPASHAEYAREMAPGAVVDVYPNSGHFPHKDHPDRFVKDLRAFVNQNQPASYHRGRWRALIRNGATPKVREIADAPAEALA